MVEWISYDAIGLLASWLLVSEFTASNCLSNFTNLLFIVPQGVSEATCVYIGNAIGINQNIKSKNNVKSII